MASKSIHEILEMIVTVLHQRRHIFLNIEDIKTDFGLLPNYVHGDKKRVWEGVQILKDEGVIEVEEGGRYRYKNMEVEALRFRVGVLQHMSSVFRQLQNLDH